MGYTDLLLFQLKNGVKREKAEKLIVTPLTRFGKRLYSVFLEYVKIDASFRKPDFIMIFRGQNCVG